MAPATIDFAGVHIWPDLWTVSLVLLPVHVQLWLHLQWCVLACSYFETTVGIVVSQHSSFDSSVCMSVCYNICPRDYASVYF